MNGESVTEDMEITLNRVYILRMNQFEQIFLSARIDRQWIPGRSEF